MCRLLILLLLWSNLVQSQPEVNITREAQRSYELILSLRFAEADVLMNQAKANDPNNLFYTYLDNYRDFLSCIISEDAELFSQLEKNKKNRIEQIQTLSDQNPYKEYLVGNINLQWAVARVKFGEYFTSALEFNRAYRGINQNTETFPDFFPNKVSLGVIHAMVGVVPDSYQWLLDIINMSGTVTQGRNELMEALVMSQNFRDFGMLQNEIQYYLGFIDLNLYSDNLQTEHWLNSLQQSDPNNLLVKYLITNILMKTGNNDLALKTVLSVSDTIAYFPFYYLNYLTAECQLRQLNTHLAKQSYHQFTKHFQGKNYIKDAYRKLAWCQLLEGDTVGYFQMLDSVDRHGYSDVGIDKEAQSEADLYHVPNLYLLKSRLLFDGGYYTQSDQQLDQLNNGSLSSEEITEKNYRKARIAEKTGQQEKAIRYFLTTIELGQNSTNYFAANSALLLGEIYEASGDIEAAKRMYRLCLDIDFTTYRFSIRGKAKQRLSRLN